MMPKIYYFSKYGLDAYADPTEPNKYPDSFTPMVPLKHYADLKFELEKRDKMIAALDKELKFKTEQQIPALQSLLLDANQRVNDLEMELYEVRQQLYRAEER